MWLCRAEVGPGYDRFAWLAHIRQIHGSRSRIVEIPLRPLLPYWDDTMILGYQTLRAAVPHTSSSSSSTAFMPRASDLDGLSTGDLSMVYGISLARTRESCGKSCNSVLQLDSTIPPSQCKSNVENRRTLIYGAETVFRIETVLRYEIKHRKLFLVS